MKAPDLKLIYNHAAALDSPTERAAYLDEACRQDIVLRGEVEGLLLAAEQAGSFMQSPAVARDITEVFPRVLEEAGTVIGPYKLLQQIGEGGMGIVFMAEQSEPIQRTVALKIIKPGMDTRQVIARFEAERQAVAMMDHPNIAKVLDAGTTDSGRPYFVMELVKGVPITKFCDEKHLSLRARLELLLPVCQAVQHAHQKGVIHRDIKPTNVLVAEYDDHAVPKVIDFGVAKATASKLTERTLFTEFGQMIGTVEYMSPEQAKLNQLDIDTRSDIYSLGVLLYELLTGSTPFGRKRLNEAAFDEMLRIIREEEPPKPSTRLSTTDGMASIAASRASEPKKLSGLVKGELDWVVMKALEKDRNRRYETANDLAADVQRYLHNEPVQACSPSATYLFRKFALRNKAAIVTAAVVAASLVLGTAVSIWQAVRATDAEALAQTRLESESQSLEAADEARRDAERQSEFATREQQRAMDAEQGTRRHLHAAQLNLAAASAFRGQLAETMAILESQRSSDGGAASRGFGWRYLWRLCHEGHQLTLRGHHGSVSSVKIARDGKLLASGSADGTIRLWDLTSGHVRILTNGTVAVRSIAISPDGEAIAAGSDDGMVSLWDTATGTRTTSSHRHERPVRCVAFSPDGKLVVSSDALGRAGLRSIGEIVICETVGGREVARYAQAGYSLAFSPDGKTLAVTGWYDGLKLVDVANGEVRRTLYLRFGVAAAAFCPDGKTIAGVSDDGMVNIWNVATGLMLSSCRGGSTASARCVAFSADGTRLACGRADGMLDLWDLANGRVRSQAHGKSIRTVAFSPDGASLASGSDDGTIMLWDAEFRPEASPVDGHKAMIWSVNFSPDGRTLASACDDRTIKLWDVPTGQVRATLKGHTATVVHAAFSPDGRMLASGGDDDTVRLWDVATGQQLAVLQGHTNNVHAVAFSPDGKSLASGSGDTTVKIWDVATKAERATLAGHASPVWSVAFSPDGKSLASAAISDDVRLWDLASNAFVRTLPDTRLIVQFSRDGKTLETRGFKDKSLVFWDLGKGAARATLAKGLVDNFDLVAACSSDGSGLVVSREDGSIREIDAATSEERVLLPSDDGPGGVIAYSPDGNTVVSGSRSGQVRFWRAASEQEVTEQGVSAGTENDTVSTMANLAYNYQQLIRQAKALKLREETLPVRPAKIEADHPETREYAQRLATLYRDMGKNDEAKALLQQASDEKMRDPQVFKRFADHFARLGEWKLAAQSFAQAFDLNPADEDLILSAAVTAVETGDLNGYRRVCQLALKQFAATNDPAIADRTARAGLLTAEPGGDLKQLVKLAEVAVENGKEHKWFDYFQMDRGIAAYRSGDWAGTLDWCARSRKRGLNSPSAVALALLFEAMAHHQLDHADQARVAMDQATALIDEYLAGAKEDRGTQWKFWLVCQISRREAEALFKQKPQRSETNRQKAEKPK